jgi:hypothetical protein
MGIRAGKPARFCVSRGYSVSIQAVFDTRGNPLLVANFSPNGGLAKPHWAICRPGATCTPAGKHHRKLEPGAQPAGTVFRATVTYHGRSYAAAAVWHGRVHSILAPSLAGAPMLGTIVRPIAGRWTGGWGGETDQLGVEACRTRAGGRCVMLSGGAAGCPVRSIRAVVHRWLRGRYLFALDQRLARDNVCAGVAYGSERDVPVWRVGQTVARSAPAGPVR